MGQDFQRELQKCVCYEHSVVRGMIPQQEKERWVLGRHSFQSLAPLLALKILHVKLSLLQIRLLLCIGTSVLFTCEENMF